MISRSVWQLERYDHHWGGWRGLPASIETDEPMAFDSISAGLTQIRWILTEHPHWFLRLYDPVSGEVRHWRRYTVQPCAPEYGWEIRDRIRWRRVDWFATRAEARAVRDELQVSSGTESAAAVLSDSVGR